MNKVYCILRNLNGDILVKKDGKYYSPIYFEKNNQDNKAHLSHMLYKTFGLSVKKSYLILKEDKDGDLYYYCDEPYTNEEFHAGMKKIIFIPVDELKEKISPKNKNLYNVLTKILHSKFSFSKIERDNLKKSIIEAQENNDPLLVDYLLDKMHFLIMGKEDQLVDIEIKYKNHLIETLCFDLQLAREKNLSETNIDDLTHKEAIELGKEDEWHKKYYPIFKFVTPRLPGTPARQRFDYLEEACKLDGKNSLTINILIDLYRRYKDMGYYDMKEDLLKRKKEKKKKEKEFIKNLKKK